MTAAGDSTRRPLVIAVEGPSFAGKTTLASAIAPPLGAVVVPEYSDMAALPPFPPQDLSDVAAALDHFLRLEVERSRLAVDARTPVAVTDRSPLTLIAYEFAIAALGVPANPQLAVRLYSEAADEGRILHPDGYLYLRITDEVTTARTAARGPIASHLSLSHVRDGMDRVCQRYLASLAPLRWLELDGAAPLRELVHQATAFVRRLSSEPRGTAPAWWTLADSDPVRR